MQENPAFLKEQIITYLGNKRALLGFLKQGFDYAKKELKKEKLSFLDMFSGSGIVSRFAKAHSDFIIANDLELYSKIINSCYLANLSKDELENLALLHQKLLNAPLKKGFITELYAPKDENAIQKDERVFYTKENALYLDSLRQAIDKQIPKHLRQFFLAPLLYEASVHANTSGVFKGFYKDKNGVGKFGGVGENALSRIRGKMCLKMPVFSNFHCEFEVLQKDANLLSEELERLDLAYFDPPYNQHPYGSNYFMLNLLATYEKPTEISKVSGIPKQWNRSVYNKAKEAEDALFELMAKTRAKILLLSYNCEGFVKKENFIKRLEKLGKCFILEQNYNAFRASRNLKNRPIHIKEQLYIVKKA
ncbi:DNA adenine methylase [Campylobacter helveticus]|uniref:DNA adenine methylase n=1 Tax=Campylobacter helveticus TaxID=28898 RepID=UPI0009C21231|nr:DNA adenine methylase [Campylobacter helveticus]ARE79695.1 adenine-specific DNA methyltransferase (EcoRI methylase) [Campylobacter helveticus]TNH32310.1 DNA modification methylase [Campylobacter helveticus]TXK57804.1 DNA modification methylase [Campylobacter helveticus]SMC19738.1 adenine-specific DNA-methyltransferase [Campylobacter helveticus]SUW82354.1 D12 class N6 adenine-specific DNA methyltransferase [Campylobacter helveticus]